MTTLYVSIDESGNHTRDDCYVVAGCWYLSSRANPTNVLTGTKDRLLRIVEQDPRSVDRISELKGSAIRPETLNDRLPYLRECIYDDRTTESAQGLWQLNIPIGFTFFTTNARLSAGALEGLVGSHDRAEVVRISALTTIIAPLFDTTHIDLMACDEVRVLLDAET